MVGLRIIQSVEDANPTVVPTESCPEALEEDNLPQVKRAFVKKVDICLDGNFRHLIKNLIFELRWKRLAACRSRLRMP